ncbi:MAG TPA: hypothetical protein VNO50_14175, partial [Pyrinomonadaceae bacterium]|nr:hypothetical protein [Pyrinomonadaceae bacterium]
PPESDEVTINRPEAESVKPKEEGDPAIPKDPAKDINKELKPEQGKEQDAAAAPSDARPATRQPSPAPLANLVIDFDGLASRVARVPLEANNYGERVPHRSTNIVRRAH